MPKKLNDTESLKIINAQKKALQSLITSLKNTVSNYPDATPVRKDIEDFANKLADNLKLYTGYVGVNKEGQLASKVRQVEQAGEIVVKEWVGDFEDDIEKSIKTAIDKQVAMMTAVNSLTGSNKEEKRQKIELTRCIQTLGTAITALSGLDRFKNGIQKLIKDDILEVRAEKDEAEKNRDKQRADEVGILSDAKESVGALYLIKSDNSHFPQPMKEIMVDIKKFATDLNSKLYVLNNSQRVNSAGKLVYSRDFYRECQLSEVDPSAKHMKLQADVRDSIARALKGQVEIESNLKELKNNPFTKPLLIAQAEEKVKALADTVATLSKLESYKSEIAKIQKNRVLEASPKIEKKGAVVSIFIPFEQGEMNDKGEYIVTKGVDVKPKAPGEQAQLLFDYLVEINKKYPGQRINIPYPANDGQAKRIKEENEKTDGRKKYGIDGSGIAPVFKELEKLLKQHPELEKLVFVKPVTTVVKRFNPLKPWKLKNIPTNLKQLINELMAISDAAKNGAIVVLVQNTPNKYIFGTGVGANAFKSFLNFVEPFFREMTKDYGVTTSQENHLKDGVRIRQGKSLPDDVNVAPEAKLKEEKSTAPSEIKAVNPKANTFPHKAPNKKQAIKPNGLDYKHLFKFSVYGEQGAEVSNLISRFTDNKYSQDGLPKPELRVKTVAIEGENVKLQIWDRVDKKSGFREIESQNAQGNHGAIIAIDLTDKGALEGVEKKLVTALRDSPQSQVLIVGIKSDGIERPQQITTEDLQGFAKKMIVEHGDRIDTAECNPRAGDGVNEVFQKLAKQCLGKISPVLDEKPQKNINVGNSKQMFKTLSEHAFPKMIIENAKQLFQSMKESFKQNKPITKKQDKEANKEPAIKPNSSEYDFLFNFSVIDPEGSKDKSFTDFKIKTLKIGSDTVKIQAWGQSESQYSKGGHAIIAIFDLTDSKSLAKLDSLLRDSESIKGEDCKVILVGTKSDGAQQVTDLEIKKVMNDHHIVCFEKTSAKTGENVEKAFRTAAALVLEHVKEQAPSVSMPISPRRN